MADAPSNWRSQGDLRGFLQEAGTVAMEGIDTRALTRHLRVRGVMMGCVTTELSREEAMARLTAAPDYSATDWVRQVSTEAAYVWKAGSGVQAFGRSGVQGGNAPRTADIAGADRLNARTPERLNAAKRVVLVDCGVKFNILRELAALGCETTVVPC